jgi:polyisoprenoid-binding protein YceI
MQIYTVDPDRSELSFAVRGIPTTRGSFTPIVGTVTVDEEDNPQSLEVNFAARSLNTRLWSRDLHLKTASFFDVRRYSEITYRSQRIERTGPDHFTIYGLLRLHGLERPIQLDATLESDREGDGRYRAHVTGTLLRSEFNVPRNPILRAIILPVSSDEVAVTADVVTTLVRESHAAEPLSTNQSQQ